MVSYILTEPQEERVRQIVREEIKKALAEIKNEVEDGKQSAKH